jgi:hypothetical protein
MIRQPIDRDIAPRADDRAASAAARQDSAEDFARSQDLLWAACLAGQPNILSDIASFIRDARMRVMESPPLSPGDAPRSDEGSGEA